MKRTLIIALLVAFTAGTVFAGGFYRTSPDSDTCKSCTKDCKIKSGLGWIIKLPFRLVAATGQGLYGLIAHQELDGFEDGYNAI